MITLLLITACIVVHVAAPRGWALVQSSYEVPDLFTSLFVHLSTEHLACNMVLVLCFGWLFERKFGGPWILVFFLATGALSSAAEIWVFPEYSGQIVGASGAAYALAGAYSTDNRYSWILTIPLFLWLASMSLYSDAPQDVSHVAHLSGFVLGLLFALCKHGASHPGDYTF